MNSLILLRHSGEERKGGRLQNARSKENATPWDPTVGICAGPFGGPTGVAVSYERGTPAATLRSMEAALMTGQGIVK